MTETLKAMEIELNLDPAILIMKILKERHQVETIKSYLPNLNLSTSDLYSFNLELTLRLIAFILLIFKHFLLISTPVP